jgi:hypothetical protein
LVALERDRAVMEAASAPEAAGAGARLATRVYEDRRAASLMETAKAFAEAGMTALLASIPDLTVQFLSPSPEARLGERLKGPLAAAGGTGGGGPASFRAMFENKESLDRFINAAEALLSDDTGPN